MSENLFESYTTFGELLRQLRRRARLTQRELGIEVGYSEAQITRLEGNVRLPDVDVVATRFVDALQLQAEPELARRLVELAAQARGEQVDEVLSAPTVRDVLKRKRTNIPAAISRLIGREANLIELQVLLQANRLVCLVGTGGVGKTRLAQEVGTLVLGSFPDGVWMVELAPVSDPAMLAKTVADTFGLPDQPNRSAEDVLFTFLPDRSLLLVLDNCEHLIAASAALVESLLERCPNLHILVTSREPLHAAGEVLYNVAALRTPDLHRSMPNERLADYESVQLFVELAKAAQAGFAPTTVNLPAIALLCARLDGIPLAIEMAAARLPTMTLTEIVSGLDNRFTLLTRGRRTAGSRQQTLRATMDWSYRLLDDQEKRVLARHSVFADGCYVDAARAVCADPTDGRVDRITPEAVMPLLLDLADKSLLVVDHRNGQTRYRQLETVRQFAQEKLAEMGEQEEMHQRYLDFLLSLSIPVGAYPIGRARLSWYERQDEELGNVRAMLTWARSLDDTGERMMRLVAAWWPVWLDRGYHFGEGITWLEDALSHEHGAPPLVRLAVLRALTVAYLTQRYFTQQPSDARGLQVANQLYELAVSLGHFTYAANALDSLAEYAARNAFHSSSRYDDAVELCEKGLAIMDAPEANTELTTDPRLNTELLLLNTLARLRVLQGDLSSALPLANVAVDRAIEGDNLHGLRTALLILSALDSSHALASCERAMARQRQLNSPDGLASILDVYAAILANAGDLARAKTMLEDSQVLWQQLGVAWSIHGGYATTMSSLAYLCIGLGDFDQARDLFTQCAGIYRDLGSTHDLADMHFGLGVVALKSGDLSQAEMHLTDFLNHQAEAHHQLSPNDAIIFIIFAHLAFQSGQLERAATLYGIANRLKEQAGQLFQVNRWLFDGTSQALHELDGDTYASARQAGERMNITGALDYLLRVMPQSGQTASLGQHAEALHNRQ